jgi:hypothetical protein
MLVQQPWSLAPSPDPFDAERFARDQRKRQRRAEDLPPAFTAGTINCQHGKKRQKR